MTFVNRIFRFLPKKKVNPEEINRKYKKNIPVTQIPIVTKSQYNIDEEEGQPNEDGSYEIIEREIMPEKIVCPYCGEYTLEGLDFCDKCNGDLTNI